MYLMNTTEVGVFLNELKHSTGCCSRLGTQIFGYISSDRSFGPL